MDHREIVSVLEQIRNHPKTAEMLKTEKTLSREEAAEAYAVAAKTFGYTLTAEEILSAIQDRETKIQVRTEGAAEELRAIPEEEMAEVSGGGDHDICYDTYKDRENCWWSDGCDIIHNYYHGYQCKSCNEGVDCGEAHYDL